MAGKKPTTTTTTPSADLGNSLANALDPATAARIQQLMQQYNTGSSDPNDLPVWIGTTDSNGRVRRQNGVVSSSKAYVNPYQWKPSDLSAFQRRMFVAGLYGNARENEIPWGTVDPLTDRAWRQLVDTAALYYTAGKKITPQQVLDQMGVSPTAGGGSQTSPATNPADLAALANQTSTNVLGRDLTSEEKTRVAGRLQAAEAPFLAANSSVERPGTAALTDVARQQVRAIDPIRADSRNVVHAASVLEQMLAGRLPSSSDRLASEVS